MRQHVVRNLQVGVDLLNVVQIFEALDRAIAGRTTFIVAHRLSTLRRADFIIVLERGRIVQRGTHEELMRSRGLYHAMVRRQVEAGAEDGIIDRGTA